MRLFGGGRRPESERLLWSRDIRFVRRLARALPGARLTELDSGACLVAPSATLTDAAAAEVARATRDPEYGVVSVDSSLPERDRYVIALSGAVQLSGLADRIGMAPSAQVAQTKLLDLFLHLAGHAVHFQPIVDLSSNEVFEYECLFRPHVGPLPTTVSAIVRAAIETDRSVELDTFVVDLILERVAAVLRERPSDAAAPSFSINVTPPTLLDPRFEARAFASRIRVAGLLPRQVTLEVTEQQAVSDVVPLQRHVKALRRLGFGFAVDDAGAGYASFALVAALRPTIIKIDREIVRGVGRGDAKQALVEAFVSFGRRIGALIVGEGIERRADLEALRALGVQYGQGFLLGKPAVVPLPARRLNRRQLATPPAGRPVARSSTLAPPARSPVD